MSRTAPGLALLLLLSGHQVDAQTAGISEVAPLAAAGTYAHCLSRAKNRAILDDDAPPDFAVCDAQLERNLSRAGCGEVAEAAALGSRLRTTLGLEPATDVVEEAHFTPVVMSVLAPPHPVPGSDGRTHLVYELQITNASAFEWQLEAMEVLDGDDPARVMLAIAGEEVPAKVQSLGDRSALRALAAGQSALVFIHLPLAPEHEIPRCWSID